MVTIGIVALLINFAAPSFSGLLANQRAKSVASELFASLTLARSSAISTNSNVTVSPRSASWQNGWQVLNITATVLDERGAVTGATIIGPAGNISYRASGRIQANAAPLFVISATVAGGANINQCVSIDLTGRPYMKAAAAC